MTTFPILRSYQRKNQRITSVPWGMVEPHRKRAMATHYQTLERLAERGGLSPLEMLAVLDDLSFEETRAKWGDGADSHEEELIKRVNAWESMK